MNKKHTGLQRILDLILIVAVGLVVLALMQVAQFGTPAGTTPEATVLLREASPTPPVETPPYPLPDALSLVGTPTDMSPADMPPYPAPGTPSGTPLPTLTPSLTPTATPTPLVMPNGWYLYEDPD